MEPIKVNVQVSVDLSSDAKAFIASLLTSNAKTEVPAQQVAKEMQNGATIATPRVAPALVTSDSPAPVTSDAPVSAPAPAPVQNVTVEQVRQVLSQKVSSHREEIKAKLEELGAPSVSKLDPSKYVEMLDFLIGLA